MIHSASPTVSPVANIVFAWNLFCFEKWGWTDARNRAKTMIVDYRPWLRVGRVDQKTLRWANRNKTYVSVLIEEKIYLIHIASGLFL